MENRVKVSEVKKSTEIIDKIMAGMPEKTARKRREHFVVKDGGVDQKIEANDKTIPGILSSRGCAYAGAKGVVFGPVKDMLHLTHGPIGCAYFTWNTRRNFAEPEPGKDYYMGYCLSTDMQESDIIFGGEKKLAQAIREAYQIFEPKAIGVYSTCPVGLIGDDIETVARQAAEELGIKVIPVRCEGYRGVSQSAGHHIASNCLMQHVIGTSEPEETTPFDINIFGEYNIGGDLWAVKPLLEKIGYRVVATFTGDGSYESIARAHRAKLSILMCHRSINYTNRMMEQKWGVPWLKVNYIGIDGTVKSLRHMAKFFDDPGITARTEEAIKEGLALVEPRLDYYRRRLAGKKAMVFAGGSRSHHYINLFESLGMDVIVSGYQFAHRDDYEGRKVIPEIKHKATSAILEDLVFERQTDAGILDEDKVAKLQKEIPLMDYEGMMVHVKDGQVVVDDLNHYETEHLIREFKPAVFCSGIKDKYVVEKMGVPSRQIHSYDYSGPYAGFEGFINFARDVEMAVNSPTWKYVRPPWKKAAKAANAK